MRINFPGWAVVIAWLAGAGLLQAAEAERGITIEGVGKVTMAGGPAANLKADSLRPALTNLLALLDSGKLPEMRVRVSKEHPLMKDALQGPSLRIERLAGVTNRYLLIPVKNKGARVFTGRDAAWLGCQLLEVPAGVARVDFDQCCK
jgi:hypothetical protein